MAAHPPLSVIFIARGFRAHNRLASVGRRRRRTGRYKYICCYRVSVCNNLWTVPADRTHTKKETRHTGMNDINDGVCAPKCLFSRALTFDGTPAAKANGHAVSHGSVAPPPVVADISALDVNALRRADAMRGHLLIVVRKRSFERGFMRRVREQYRNNAKKCPRMSVVRSFIFSASPERVHGEFAPNYRNANKRACGVRARRGTKHAAWVHYVHRIRRVLNQPVVGRRGAAASRRRQQRG